MITVAAPPHIKPCPFCGETPKLVDKAGELGYTPDSCSIFCGVCHCGFMEDRSKWSPKTGHVRCDDEARLLVVEKWNTRKS